jgi:pimeloyl-ACP methyl ester carboxylesterase
MWVRFIFVHGGFHGAWCWEKLIPEFTRRGHDAFAIDCPGHGQRADEDATLAGYRDAVVDVIRPGDIIVAHSMGGLTATVAADAAIDKVGHIVYLASSLPVEGQPAFPVGGGNPSQRPPPPELIDGGRKMQLMPRDEAAAAFYHDCSPEIIDWAFRHLTPQPVAPLIEPVSVPRFWASAPPRSLILCSNDRVSAASEGRQMRMSERLGVEPLLLDTSHSPFLSQPAACAEAILESLKRPGTGPVSPG